jgi:hypothetical protein
MTVSVGLAGAGGASAASAALHIKPGAKWYVEVSHGCREVETFQPGNFTGDKGGDAGTWTGGGTMIDMTWTAGLAAGETFSGTFTLTPQREYRGTFSFDGNTVTGKLVKRATLPGC